MDGDPVSRDLIIPITIAVAGMIGTAIALIWVLVSLFRRRPSQEMAVQVHISDTAGHDIHLATTGVSANEASEHIRAAMPCLNVPRDQSG